MLNVNLSPSYANTLQIGAFEAKTKFAELLRKVEEGFIYSITRNGKTVAVMQSPETKKQSESMKAFNRVKTRAEKLKNNSQAFSISEIEELKNDGRKY